MASSTADPMWQQPSSLEPFVTHSFEGSSQTHLKPSSPYPMISSSPSDGNHTPEDDSSGSPSPAIGPSDTSSLSELVPDEDTSKAEDQSSSLEQVTTQVVSQNDVSPMLRRRSSTIMSTQGTDTTQRLTAAEIHQLTSSPDSLPVAPAPPQGLAIIRELVTKTQQEQQKSQRDTDKTRSPRQAFDCLNIKQDCNEDLSSPSFLHRTVSSPIISQHHTDDRLKTGLIMSQRRNSATSFSHSQHISLRTDSPKLSSVVSAEYPSVTTTSKLPGKPPLRARTASRPSSPLPQSIPLPPMSLPTHLQLELAAQRPSPLYIHQSYTNEVPYESSAIKFERLKNVFTLPPFLERTLYFGALACLDAWLYNFTILPVRFIIAISILLKWWTYIIVKEGGWLVSFVWNGLGRLWNRGKAGHLWRPSEPPNARKAFQRSSDAGEPPSNERFSPSESQHHRVDILDRASSRTSPIRQHTGPQIHVPRAESRSGHLGHRRTKSVPSSLSTFHKADLLQGAVIICSSIALMSLDASRMYHLIRAQSAIKLYVIYNILEVGDRLLSAIGQDIFECLFSAETLSRNASGRSKVFLPFGMFVLALLYNCLHSITLYYQVITLNVAVNSYSNALLTLLMSNQFVEIKSTVFKRFERDNLFQLTCADIVERFQLWIMLLIIGLRNAVEVGGLSIPGAGTEGGGVDDHVPGGLHSSSILPHSFTVLPSWLKSGEVLSPFLIVIGSEMLVDSIKHAYVTKFNNIKPGFYSRILDILCKDYYTNAFTTPSVIRRLGLAVIPLSCLFIRASVQTYHMFLSTHLSMPMPKSTQTSLSEESAVPSSPAMLVALNRFDSLLRDSLGRATYGYPYGSPLNQRPWYAWTSDDFIAAITMVVFFFMAFLVLLILKLLLGMVLLKYARNRYAKMKQKEQAIFAGRAERESYEATGRRIGGYGGIELGDDRSKWLHADQNEGLNKRRKEPEREDKQMRDNDFDGVFRFEMVNKRIW